MIRTVIVEDDLMVASLNAEFANRTPGVEVLATFHNGRDALKFLEDNEADLLLLDLYMPEMSGLDLLKALRRRGSHVGVIMITAANDAVNIVDAFHLGIVDYLVKPFQYERFAAAVKRFNLQRELIDKNDSFTQEEIDRLLAIRPEAPKKKEEELRKGLQHKTLDKIRGCLSDHAGEFLSCDRIAEEVCLSTVTVRHYLSYIIENGEAESRINYLTGGHPSTEYRQINVYAGDNESGSKNH